MWALMLIAIVFSINFSFAQEYRKAPEGLIEEVVQVKRTIDTNKLNEDIRSLRQAKRNAQEIVDGYQAQIDELVSLRDEVVPNVGVNWTDKKNIRKAEGVNWVDLSEITR